MKAESRIRESAVTRAEVAELADAHGSGPCTRKGVGVRVPSSAPIVSKALSSVRLPGHFCFDPISASHRASPARNRAMTEDRSARKKQLLLKIEHPAAFKVRKTLEKNGRLERRPL
jgi:hypothetical protein